MTLETLSGLTKQELRIKAIEYLNNSEELKLKIHGMCHRHNIPTQAEIQQDILQVTLEQVFKYNIDKLSELMLDTKNKNRLMALAVRLALRNGVYFDKRIAKGYNKSVGQQILYQSNLSTLNMHLEETDVDDMDDYNGVILADDPELHQTEHDQREALEEQENKLWEYIEDNLTPLEFETYQYARVVPEKRMKIRMKREYNKLLIKLKQLITDYETKNNYQAWKRNNN